MNDDSNARSGPATPWLLLGFIALLAAIHLARMTLSAQTGEQIARALAFMPAQLGAWLRPEAAATAFAPYADGASFLEGLRAQGPQLYRLATYALVHANLEHILINAFWLLAFGASLERRWGPLRLALFMSVAAIAGALAQWLAEPFGVHWVVGASAIDSAAIGAVTRFAFEPGAALGARAPGAPARYDGPAVTLMQALRNGRTLTFVLIWLASNFLFGVTGFGAGEGGAIAWQAHLGGFFLGLVGFALFDRKQKTAPPLEA
jgi:membrane associated rhomboid family serine protease